MTVATSRDFPDDTVQGMVTVHLPSRYGYLNMIRKSVRALCRRAGLKEEAASQLEMAVDESCANIIEHSYGGEADKSNQPGTGQGMKLNFIQQDNQVVVEVFDFGVGFNFRPADLPRDPVPLLDETHERGLGLVIINRFVDEVEYRQDVGQSNCLRLIKYR